MMLDKVYNFPHFWMASFVAFLTVTTRTITSPAITFKAPVRFVSDRLKSVSGRLFDGAKYTVKRVFVGTGLSLVMVWTSVLLYACFYRFYVPTASLVRPAHFQFRVCPNGVGICSFPKANITLCAPSCAEVLGRGQQYRVVLQLLIPDSAPNRDIGMFMVHGNLYDQHGSYIKQSSRAVSVKYQSDTLKLIQSFVLFPFYFTAFAEEIQTLEIELFEDFWDDYYQPAIGALLEIHSHHLTFYSAELQFHARYAGLKYYLFHYPVSSAVCGVVFNCLWMTVAFLLTWYQLGVRMLEGWLTRFAADLSSSAEEAKTEAGKESEMNGAIGNGECCRGKELGEAEKVRSYVQPFTIATSAKRIETAEESDGGSTHIQPVTETLSHRQQVKSSKDHHSHTQPFTLAVAAPKQTEMSEKMCQTEPKKVLKAATDFDNGGELRHRKKWFSW